jgi:hypothetical protein
MAGAFSVRLTGTAVASATLPFGNLVGSTTARVRLYEYHISYTASPADTSVDWQIQLGTTAGTPGSNPSIFPVDKADRAAIATAGLLTFSAQPTLTANAFLDAVATNQRATIRYVSTPGLEYSLTAATSSLNVMTPTVNGSPGAEEVMVYYFE